MARIYRERVKDTDKARVRPRRTRLLDATNDDAAALLGDMAYDDGHGTKTAAPAARRAAEHRAEGSTSPASQTLARSGDGARAPTAFRTAEIARRTASAARPPTMGLRGTGA